MSGVGAIVLAVLLHTGLDLRSELGVHLARLCGGVAFGRVDVALTLDPLWLLDRQHALDAIVEYRPHPDGWGVFAGWRLGAIGVADGTQWQESPLVGVSGGLPRLASWLRLRAGVELATLVVKHGAGLPVAWIGADRGVIDHLNLEIFLRVEVAFPR